MKTRKLNSIAVISLLLLSSCGKSFLERLPQGELAESQVVTADGVEGTLLGAYGILNGNVNGTWGNYASAPSQWIFGEMAADNAHKGSEPADQPNMNSIEYYNSISTNDNFSTMWQVYYEGIMRANSTLRLLAQDQAGAKEVSAERAIEIQGEAKMLRAHYYFFLWRVFRNLPYIDENTTVDESKTMPNDTDVLPKIIADLESAVENLPVTKINGESGRMTKNIAKAYLGKVYLYQKKYPEALALFNEVLEGKDITAMPFQNNFNVETEDGPEALFVSKHAINSDGAADNANVGDMLSGINGGPIGCCGFYQPTIDLVNAFKVDANGLPLLNGEYRTNPYTSDLGLSDAEKTSYQLDVSLPFDPRLDYTVGRRGVHFLDYGVMPGDTWIRDANQYAGPFVAMKAMIPTTMFATQAQAGANYVTGLDVNIMRLADVVLMAAECYVELNQLDQALALVNSIRERAAKLPAKKSGNNVDAAKYSVKPYPSFPSQDYARDAVRFERRIELALEGHRFFDLVRWGIAKQVLESYSTFEGSILPTFDNLTFNPHNEYWPIPQTEIDKSQNTLKQNDGYGN